VLFKPLWTFPDHPAVKAAVTKLFVAADSPLRPLLADWKKSDRTPFATARDTDVPGDRVP